MVNGMADGVELDAASVPLQVGQPMVKVANRFGGEYLFMQIPLLVNAKRRPFIFRPALPIG